MQAVYGPTTINILPTESDFKTATADNAWYGLRHPRSSALGNIDAALRMVDLQPTVSNFQILDQRFQAWLAKEGRHDAATGVITSRRNPRATTLKSQVATLNTMLLDRQTMIGRLTTRLEVLNWRTKSLCAELYEPKFFAAESEDLIHILEWEARATSGWAGRINRGADIDFWDERGTAEEDSLGAWPELRGAARIKMNSALQARAMDRPVPPGVPAVDEWPPWRDGVHVRKGLFCHSSAALAVHKLLTDIAVVEGGLSYRIRSIDVVHQLPEKSGGISHWWVCVNKPDEIRLSNRTIRFDRLSQFALLPFVGGFVADIWGALWMTQSDAAQKWATSADEIQNDCVQAAPFIQLEEGVDSQIRVYTHHLIP